MINTTQPVETTEGFPVRLLCNNSRVPYYPLIGLIQLGDGKEQIGSWTDEGHFFTNSTHRYDLQNAPTNTAWAWRMRRP